MVALLSTLEYRLLADYVKSLHYFRCIIFDKYCKNKTLCCSKNNIVRTISQMRLDSYIAVVHNYRDPDPLGGRLIEINQL